jgi:hypothetical protein
MNLVSVAVGRQYEMEVQRLVQAYPQTILITNNTPGIETQYKFAVLNGLTTKANFANLISAHLTGPVVLMDADLHPVAPDPLQHFQVQPDTDIAYVVYAGTWHYPAKLKHFEMAIRKVGKINSGFMYFKNIHIAKDVCTKWSALYKERMNEYLEGKTSDDREGEYDEPSLCLVLAQENYKLEYLDPKWNCWNTGPQCDHPLFVQSHLAGHDPYAESPTICNNFW